MSAGNTRLARKGSGTAVLFALGLASSASMLLALCIHARVLLALRIYTRMLLALCVHASVLVTFRLARVTGLLVAVSVASCLACGASSLRTVVGRPIAFLRSAAVSCASICFAIIGKIATLGRARGSVFCPFTNIVRFFRACRAQADIQVELIVR
ncbi:MAG TPA: hypothetical protein VFA65_06450 [Bryobacteraceae bacterium]|nr:hypothetical protein [Bryobacteraceae bacterium]